VDIAALEWSDDIGHSIRFSDLQSFQVVFLPALRDVESDLRNFRSSPLARLIAAMDIGDAQREDLLEKLREANLGIAQNATIEEIAKAVDASFKSVAGPAFSMGVKLGVAEPSFQAIVRALRLLLSNAAMSGFDPSSNGLGLNNVLYVAILIEYFHRRLAQKKSAGQIILLEEPEAHLHPQLQLSLFSALSALPFQSILTTHSTHITANAGLPSYVVLTQSGTPAISSAVPAGSSGLESSEIRDLERYLDATKSSLLYARKVMLVEGPAELLLIPALVRQVKGIDLERGGISVIPIYGTHFDAYSKLFSPTALRKKCAIVADGDLKADDANPELAGEDPLPPPLKLEQLNGDYVRVFVCATTFEHALTIRGTVNMLADASQDVGAPKVAQRLRNGIKDLEESKLDETARKALVLSLRDAVLNTAVRFGKARFAQIAARHVEKATGMPKYISDAVDWLLAP
jgi:putative ATP-dependent endonuclease of OLD family